LLEKDLTPEIISDMYKRNVVIPAISLLVIVISLLGVDWSMLLYFSVPFIFWAVHRSHRKMHEMAVSGELRE
jgi:hypothetical protein